MPISCLYTTSEPYFPYLCDKDGKPKEGVLEKAESSFESYSGDNVSVIGQTKIYAKNKQTQQFMMTRIFVIARERGPILLAMQHANGSD